MTWREWGRSLWDGWREDRVPLTAAGVTYYLLLAIFPALAAFVVLYGLFLDPARLADQAQAQALQGVVPPAMAELLTGQMQRLAAGPPGGLGLGAALALVLSLWGANGGVKALIEGLNIAHGLIETRSFLKLNLLALAFTLGLMLLLFGMIALLAILPAIIGFLPLGDIGKALIAFVRWPVLALMVGLALLALYRWGPNRPPPPWRRLVWSSGLAALGWLVVSALFAIYVGSIADFGASYGAMASPVAVLLWLWLMMIVVLLGAEIAAEAERRSRSG